MLKRLLTMLVGVVAIAGFAQVAHAQYMYLDSNGNGIHDSGDVMNANGNATTVNMWVDTAHNRDGSASVCDTGDGNLTINSYVVEVAASGGNVTYSGFINQQAANMPTNFGEVNTGNNQYKNGFGGGTQLAAGLYKLCTVTITGATGSPSIAIVDQIPGTADFTSFGTACSGNDFDNTYKLTGPHGGSDWTDVDGLGAAPSANNPPTINSPGNKTVNELTNLAFTVTGSDPDAGQTITFTQTLGSPAATGATTSAAGAFSWTPTEAQGPGVYPITFTATDNGAPPASSSTGITVTVNEVNQPPAFNPAPTNQTVNELANLAFTLTATDADLPAQTLTFSQTLGSPAATGATTSAAGAFSWTPTEAQGPGVYPITFNVSDGTATTSSSITITVNEVNQAPVINNPGNQTVNELVNLAFTVTATDADLPAQTLTFSQTLGSPVATGATTSAAGAFSWTPTEAQGPGVYPITFNVSDGTATSSTSITITVNEVNQAPVITNPGNKTINELANLAFTVTATDADIPAQTLTFSQTLGSPAATGATTSAAGAFSWTPTEAQGPGVYPITFNVSDGTATSSTSITITVNEVNQAPVINNPGNQTVNELVNLAFTVTATDADIPAQTLTFSQTLGSPAATGATTSAAGAFSWTPTEAQGPGVYPITFNVSDGTATSSTSITVTVNEVNQAPVINNPGNQTVNELVNLAFTVTATDADIPAQTLTFSQTLGSPAATGATTSAAGAFSWTPTEAQGPGVYPITFNVSDGVATSSTGITITVNEVNQAPVITNPGNKTVNELVNLAFTVTATDADIPAQTLTFSQTLGSPAATGATTSAAGAFSWTPTEAQGPGVYPITFNVSDGVATSSTGITITVNEVNQAPVITNPGNKTVNELVNLAFTVTATDADLPAQTLTFSQTLGSPAATGATTSAAGAFSWTPTEAQGPGVYPITFNVSDGTATASTGITITVNEVNQAPVLNPIGNKSGTINNPVTFTATATDADIPANTLAFSLTLGSPAATGATIGAATGAFSWTPTTSGNYPVTITVTDNGTPPLSASEAIVISISGNNPPVIANPGNKTVNELVNLAFTVTATDPDAGQTVSFTQTLGSPAATGATTSAAGAFSWTPTEAQGPGVYPITFTATDNGTPPASASTSITVTVNEVNVAPVINNPGNQTVNELVNLAFTVTATDADIPANTLTFSQTLGSPAATGATTSAAGAFSWTPTEAQGPGVYPITFNVSDGSLSSSTSITVTVNEVNVAPVIANPGNQTVNELVNLAFTVTATDADIPAQTLTFSQTLGSPAATGATTSAAGAFSWTPSEAQGPGVYPITFNVSDGSLSSSTSITITVNEVNQAPVITNPGNKTVNELVNLAFTVTATDADLPAQTLTFSQTLGSPAATGATTSAAGAFSWTPTEAQGPGVYPITFNVSDGTATASTGITITVNEVNQAPVLNPIGNKAGTVATPVTFTATATDADIPANTLAFSLTLGSPAATGATINSSTGAFSWTPSASGNYPVTITVTDNGTPPLSASEAIIISVGSNNNPPVITSPGNKTVNELVNLAFTVTATDPDAGQTVTFTQSLGSPAATGATTSAGGAFSWTPTEAQGPGVYPVTFTATDNGSPPLSSSAGITITVNEVNVAPVVANPGNQTVNELVNLAFTVTATDADIPAQTLTFSQTLGSPAATGATTSAAGAFSWTPSEAQGPGVYPITFNASDGSLTGTTSITITVNEVNQAPVITNPGNKTVNELVNLAFTVTATDADLPAQTLTFSQTLGSPAATGATTSAAGAFSWTPTEAQGPGVYPITFNVSDGTATASTGITITVNEVNQAPVLNPIGNKSGTINNPVTFTATATDADIPANTLAFSLTLGSPAATGATIGAATGAFSWTPTTSGNYPVTITVTDNGTPPLSASEAIVISISGNNPPVIANPGNKTVNELVNLAFTVTATDPDAGQTVSFTQTLGSPAATGATTSAAGAFSWTPTEAQGPGVYPITFTATDNGTPPASASTSITVTVNEVNVAPVINNPGNQTVNELVNLAFTVTATDADIPANTLTFSQTLGSPAATGATTSAAGAFSWTPTEAQGPGVYPITFNVSDGSLSSSTSITVTVNEVNVAPVVANPGNQTVNELVNLAFTVTATDADIPAQTLTFSQTLGSPAATGATTSAAGAFSWTPSEAQGPGVYPITFNASDGSLTGSTSITITVNEVNQAPVINNPGNKTVNEMINLGFTVTATDADLPAQTLTFSQTLGSPAATGATTSAAGAFAWTPSEAQGPGVYPITFNVSDGTATSSTSITITVNEVNQAPVLNPIGNKSGTINNPVTFTATATDADIPANTLAFSLTLGSPAATGATIGASTGAFSWTPTTSGNYPVTITVTDNGTPPLSASEGIIIAVSGNNPPVIANPGNKTVNELVNLAFTVTATDPDAGQTITFTQTLGSPAATGATTSAAGAFSWTPTEAQGPGVYPITFTATDNGTPPASSSTGITITVNEVNQAPVINNPGNKTVNEMTNLGFTVTATDADLPAQTLTFTQTLGSPAATGATTSAAGAFSWTPSEAQGPGVYPITFNVSDGTANSSTSITITVNEVNQAPVLNPIGNKSGSTGNPITFTATATDADIPANTLAFSLTLGSPAATGATINSSTGAFSWTPSTSGAYPVTITVTDNGTPPLSASEGIIINVSTTNQPPVLAAIGNKTVNELTTLAFTATATDPNAGDVLTFTLTTGSPAATGATINGSTGAFSWTPTEAQGPGVYPVTVTVTDNGSPQMSDFEAITITVNEVNSAPVITNPGNQTVNELVNLAFTLSATDSDLPAQTLTFSQTLGSPAATGATTSAAGAFSWTPTEAQGPGVYPITFNVSDGTATSSTSITITVNEVNTAPVVNNPGNQTVNELATLSLTITATDSDIPAQALTFSLGSGAPAGAAITAAGAFSWTPTEAQGPGVYTITVIASDGSLTGQTSFSVTVNEVNTAPVLTQPSDMTLNEGQTLTQQLSATDSDVPPNTLTFSKVSGPLFETVSASGLVSLAPGSSDAGNYTSTVSVSDGSLTDSKTFNITVINVNHAPTANAGGPYTGTTGVAINFNGSGSSDPDGDPLSYAWDFGDATTGTGATVSKAYTAPGTYTVTLTVTDTGGLTGTNMTTATVVNFFPATVFTTGGNGTVSLASGKPQSCVQIQPTSGDFDINNVDLNSVVMKYGAGQISAIAGKTATDGDKNHDGITEITACFSKADFRTLFAGQPTGDYVVTLEGNLSTGGTFSGDVTLHIKNNGSFQAATISPNPLNPQAVLTFETSKMGSVRVGLYDVQGRLIRTLMEESAAQAGYHDVTIDGRDNQGNRLASGVYYVLIQSEADGRVTKAITVLK